MSKSLFEIFKIDNLKEALIKFEEEYDLNCVDIQQEIITNLNPITTLVCVVENNHDLSIKDFMYKSYRIYSKLKDKARKIDLEFNINSELITVDSTELMETVKAIIKITI